MYKIIFFLAVVGFTACKSKPATTPAGTGKKSTNDSSLTTVPSQWSGEEENQFMDNCVANALTRYNNDQKKAFSYCKCVLTQVQQRFPVADSADALMQDTVQMAAILQRCK